MLSAFTARPIIELKQRDKSKIQSILAHGDRVLVGLNTGSLRIYRLNELPSVAASASAPPPTCPRGAAQLSGLPKPGQDDAATSASTGRPTDLLREVEKFSSRAVEQLAIIKEANTLVSLSNASVSLHDLHALEPLEAPLACTKNASVFAVTSNIIKDQATGIPEIISRLAVAVKRRLLLWSWHESELAPGIGEIVLAEPIRTITWANATRLVCGMNAGYVLVDVHKLTVEEIVGPGAVAGPGRLGAVSSAGMGYMGLGGYMPKPLATRLAEGELLLAKDIHTLFIGDDGKARAKKQIPWQAAPDDIGYSYPYIVALQPPARGSLEVRNPDRLSLLQTICLPGAAALHFSPPTSSLAHAGKGFHVLSDRTVWKMDATDYDAQVDELVKTGHYDEAISLLRMLEDALLTDKAETVREVKMRKAERLFRQKRFRDSMDLFNDDEVHAPPERVLQLFPNMIAGDLSATNADREAADGCTHGHKHLVFATADADTASAHAKKDAEDGASSSRRKAGHDEAQADKHLREAVRELNSFLAGTRQRLQRLIDPTTGRLKAQPSRRGGSPDEARTSRTPTDEQLEKQFQDTFRIVDTTLFRAYMFVSPALTGSLFRIANFCDPDVVQAKLLEHNRYNELVDFLYGKKLHQQALSLLKKFGAPDKPDEAAPSLHGPQRTVAYLQTLPPDQMDLVLDFSDWILRKDPDLGMQVFLADSENAERLARHRVVDFLGGIDPSLETRYLEHIIDELHELAPAFHNRLVELYLARLRQHKSARHGEAWTEIMHRFLRFLSESRQYGLGKAFALIRRDDAALYEAQAVVLSKMGQHQKALEIYVFNMQDSAKAEDYCHRVHMAAHSAPYPSSHQANLSSAEDMDEPHPSIYHTLLALYFSPPHPHTPTWPPALDLLSKHGSRLPALSTLSLIPDTLPVQELGDYFRGRMRSACSAINETHVAVNLRKSQTVTDLALLALGDGIPGGQGGRNRRVLISNERVCGTCHKRLGGSVVAVKPDKSVVHYGCWNRRQSEFGAGALPAPDAASGGGEGGDAQFGAWRPF